MLYVHLHAVGTRPNPPLPITNFYHPSSNKHLTSTPHAATLASSRYIRKLRGPLLHHLRPGSHAQKIEHLRGPVTHLFKVSFTLDSFYNLLGISDLDRILGS